MKEQESISFSQIFVKYKYYIMLTLVIIILIIMASYSALYNEYDLYFNGNKIETSEPVFQNNNNIYISLNDLTNVFKDNAYYDRISGKVIITTYSNVIKIDKSDKDYTISQNGEIFFDLIKVSNDLEYMSTIQNNKIYISDYDFAEGNIVNNRTEIFDVEAKAVFMLSYKKDKVLVQKDDLYYDTNSKILNVIITQNNNKYFGYVLKENVKYEYLGKEEEITDKLIIVKAEQELKETTDKNNIDALIIDALRLSGINSITKLDYTKPDIDNVYASINIGQKTSNYDPDILTNMLNSENNRSIVIDKIINYIVKNNFKGIIIDFTNFRNTDKDMYFEFIKEISAIMHKNNKNIIVNLPSIDYIDITKYVDLVIINVYGEKTITSKKSGPISSITYVENIIKQIAENKEYLNKIVIEINAYSILWTERKGTLIDAEILSMPLQEEYIKLNNIDILKDSYNQKYISFVKGITSYKMWIEDVDSVKKKAELVNSYNLRGISVYKSGMELKEIYKTIKKVLGK